MPLFVALALLLAGCAAIAPVEAPPLSPAKEPSARTTSGPADDANAGATSPAPAPDANAHPSAAPLSADDVYEPARAPTSGSASSPPAAAATPFAAAPAVAPAPAPAAGEAGDDDDSDDAADEGESHAAASGAAPGLRYTGELADAELERLWKASPESLGSMSLGFVDAGRLVNGVQFPAGEGWVVISPERAWATAETIAYVQAAIRAVRAANPNAPRLRVNQISAEDGGYLRPHQSHQNGRDVDLAFYYPTEQPVQARAREKVIDLALNWALVKALATETDVEMILVDKRVQKRLSDYALAHGEDRAYVASLFHGKDALVKHARGHRDHFHVRFFNPRAQELGRRIAPLMALQPEHNLAMHRVRRGDNLGAIARKYGTTVAAIRKANHMKGNSIRAGITLSVPLRGACVKCPVPPAVVIPERRLPPGPLAAAPTASAPADAAR